MIEKIELNGLIYERHAGQWFMCVRRGEVRDRQTGKLHKALIGTPVRSSRVLRDLRRHSREHPTARPSVIAAPPTPPPAVIAPAVVPPRDRRFGLAAVASVLGMFQRRSARGR